MGVDNGYPEPITTLVVKVIPRAKKNEISQVMADGTIKIKLTAPPVKGKANIALIKFLSRSLQIPTQDIEIISGSKSRNKVVLLKGFDEKNTQLIIEKSASK